AGHTAIAVGEVRSPAGGAGVLRECAAKALVTWTLRTHYSWTTIVCGFKVRFNKGWDKAHMSYKKIIYPLLVHLMFAIPVFFWSKFIQTFGLSVLHQAVVISYKVFGVGIWLSFAWFVANCMDLFIWGKLVEPKIGSRFLAF